MKCYLSKDILNSINKSRPARGGWIEMTTRLSIVLKSRCPAPHGAGGLKSVFSINYVRKEESRPARGGWIEITMVEQISPT